MSEACFIGSDLCMDYRSCIECVVVVVVVIVVG